MAGFVWRTSRTWAIAIALAVSVSMKTLASFGLLQVRSFEGLYEAFDIPLIAVAIIGAACALCGATIGFLMRHSGLATQD